MNGLLQWLIVAFSLAGLLFNSGILYNDVKHLKKSSEKTWVEINEIKKMLMEKK